MAVLIQGLLSKFGFFLRGMFCIFIVSIFFLLDIGMRSLPDILPSVKFLNFGIFYVFPVFSCLSWKKQGETFEKGCSIRTVLHGISAMPRLILRYSIWNFIDPKMYPHTYIRGIMFFPHFFGACIDRSGTATSLSAPVGAWCYLHLACYLFQCTSRWRLLLKKSWILLDTHTLHHGMPGWTVQR